jgi:hypothetical protein
VSPHDVAGERFEDLADQPPVRGYLHRPGGPAGDGLVLGHGAGGNCHAPVLVALAAALAEQGLTVLRCDLPYRQARPAGPPRPGEAAIDRAGLRRAALALRSLAAGRLFLGGHSYGGRQASMLAAEAPDLADALLLLSYPLHPPNRLAQLRTTHFGRLSTPALFIHGTADPFGSIEEIDRARTLIPGRTALLVAEGARHDLFHTRRPGPRGAELIRRVATAFVSFAQA